MLRHEAFAATAHEPIPAALQAQLIWPPAPQPAGPGVKLVVILSALMAFGSISTDLYLWRCRRWRGPGTRAREEWS